MLSCCLHYSRLRWRQDQNEGWVDVVRVLVELGADVNMPNEFDDTPVYNAAQAGDVEVIRVLVDLGADVNALNKYCTTPMQIAAKAGNVEMIRVLAELGADIISPGNDGCTLMLSCSGSR